MDYYYKPYEPVSAANFPNSELEIVLGPNPVQSDIQLLISDVKGQFAFIIYDLQGRHINTFHMESGELINVGNLSAGLYLYQVQVNGQTAIGKFIKQ